MKSNENKLTINAAKLRMPSIPSVKDYSKTMKIKLLNDLAKIPTRGSKGAAGYDLYAATASATAIDPHTTVMIGTGLALEIPDYCFGAVLARSGIAAKRGLRPANCVGTIDSDYRGEVLVALHNDTDQVQTVESGERIAQLVLIPFVTKQLEVVDELNDTERADGGFGSTGRQ